MPSSTALKCAEHTCSLPSVPASVPVARHWAGVHLAAWGLGPDHPVSGAALLVLSELVTNSVTHAATCSPRTEIALALDAGTLVVRVHDRHPHQPRPLPSPRPEGGGWGLALVAEMATLTGGGTSVRPDADGQGKTMAVRLPVTAPSGAAATQPAAALVAT